MLELYAAIIFEYQQTRTPLQNIVNSLSRDYNLRTRFAFILLNLINIVAVHYRDLFRIMKKFLHQILRQYDKPPTTPHTQRRAETRNTNNILTESPHRRRRRPIAQAEPPPPLAVWVTRQLPARRHLLAREPVDPLLDVAHSLDLMNIVYLAF